MKKYLYLLLIPFALLTWACEEPEPEPDPEPDPETPVTAKIDLKSDSAIILSDDGGSSEAVFTSALEWEASSSESWLTVNPASGQAGDATITLTAAKNTDYDSRIANVTISSGIASKTIKVTQKQHGALVLAESEIPVGAKGGTISITAKANANVTAEVAEDAQEWIKDAATKGLTDYVFTFSIEPNASEEPRSGNIIFSNEYGSETVTIAQAGTPAEVPANVCGQVTCDGQGVPGVLISDGIDIVQTDEEGWFRLQSDKKWKYVFMTVPSGYEASAQGFLPTIHKPISANVEVADTVYFSLEPAPGDDYTLLVCGDMHLARRTGDLAQFERVAGFMNEAIANAPGKVYALTLGDMTWDMYWIANNYGFEDYIQTMNHYFPSTTFYHTMGNHDNEMEVGGDFEKALKYTENLTPDYYSFNIGKIHFIVLDDMDFTGVEPGEENRSKYAKNFTAEQLEWLKKDLSYVDKSTPVFVTAHEPLARPSGLDWKEILNGEDADLDTFIGLFDGYNVRFLSGHTHNIFNRNWTDTFTEHNSGAICASWWWSGYITPGIHIAQDGAPGGFTVWTVNGTNLTHYYQAALQSPDYQFRAYDMNSVKEVISEDRSSNSGYPKYYNHIQSYEDNVILVNVWDYDDDWKVEISENGTPLEVEEVGVYDPLHIEAMTIPRLNKYNTTTFSTAKWRHFFKATASAPDTPVTVKVTDRYGKVYTEEMTRPKPFTVDEYKNEVVYSKPEAEFKEASSNSLVFGWTCGGTAAEDAALPYKLELFKDAACTDLALSFDIPEGNDCWAGKSLRFTFGSLEPETTYYFVVTNARNGEVSDVVEGTTEAFTVVDATKVSDAAEGDIILAEDFSEIGWGADMLANAAGFIPNGKPLIPMSGNYTEEEGKFLPFDNTSGRIYGEARVDADKRLYNWGFFGNSSVYAYAGYLRVGSSSSGARTHIVSPALAGIPDGRKATIDVTVTSSKYDNIDDEEHDVAVFLNDHSALKLVLAPDQKENSNFSGSGGKYTGATLENGYRLEAKVKSWSTNTVRIENVTNTDCLIFGSYANIDKKNRFFLSDVKVQIVSLSEDSDASMKIKDEASFLEFVSTVAGGEKTLDAKLTSDITISPAAAESFSSIEDYAGTLIGNGKTISGLTKPLFNDLKGTVRNLILNSALNITTDQVDLGILANILSGTAEKCTSEGSVTFNVEGGVTEEHRIGGLLGKAESGATVSDCTNKASVINETASAGDNGGELIIGGVLGCFWGTQFTISGCTNTGAVSNNAFWNKAVSVGGIIGQAGNSSSASSNLIVSECSNSGAVSNNGDSEASNNVGGIIGWMRFGTYESNTNKGSISNSGEAPNNYIGGLFGYLDINAVFMDNSNSGTISNSGNASSANVIGGILGYIGKNNAISDAGSSAKYKFTNSGSIENSGSAKNIFIGGLFGRNSSGYFNMTGTSSIYSSNSGDITDNSGPDKSNGGDICIGGIAGYTTTGIKTQYARNTGNMYVTGDKGNTAVNVGGIGGWISNASFNFNNCRNTGNVTIDCTTSSSIWAAGIVACPKPNNTTHYYWRSNAVIDTHAATVGGENYTAGLMATVEGKDGSSVFTMYGHRLSGTVWGSKTTTGLFCCTKDSGASFSFMGGTENPNRIAPGTVRKDDNHEDTVNEISDVTIDLLAGGEGSTYDITSAVSEGQLVVEEW